MAASATESDSSETSLPISHCSGLDLWAQLPSGLQTALSADGSLPDVETLHELCLDAHQAAPWR